MPISVSSGHFALRYEVPKFLARGGHLCMAMLTIAAASAIDEADLPSRVGKYTYKCIFCICICTVIYRYG